jgi:lipoprotein-anchoring transpeptidase ErfK/SrfK
MHPIIRFAKVTIIGLLMVLALPSSARALHLSSSAIDHLGDPDLSASLASTDPTGTVVLVVDGVVRQTHSVTPGQRVDFGRVAMGPGRHTAHVMIRSARDVVRSEPFVVRVWGKPGARLTSPTPGTHVAARTHVTIQAGLSTTRVEAYLNGKRIADVAVTDGEFKNLGEVNLAAGTNTVRLVAHNPVSSSTSNFTVTRLDYPWPTCIIVDKSDFRLYWIRDGKLVKSYPVAHGRVDARTPSTVWRIDAKHFSDPSSVYGPRKLRLFRKSSSGYVYTRYLIHGTSNPSSIGTMASAGCIRMYNKDVLELFPQVPLGTMVLTRD